MVNMLIKVGTIYEVRRNYIGDAKALTPFGLVLSGKRSNIHFPSTISRMESFFGCVLKTFDPAHHPLYLVGNGYAFFIVLFSILSCLSEGK